jgi:hypothetical protein
MPYSITTKDNITIQNIPDDVAPDSQVLKDRVAAIRSQDLQGKPQEAAPGFIEGVKEAVTGAKRKTQTSEALPDWATMPELNEFSTASAKTGLGTLLSNPAETVQVIQSNYPGVQVRQDEKGNYILKSSIDNKEYAIKPGFRLSDVPRAAGGIAAFTPAGRAATLPGMAIAAGATQAGIEASQAATGGTFNPEEVGTAALLAPVIPAAVQAVKAASQPLRTALNTVRGAATPAEAAPMAAPVAAVPEVPAVAPTATPASNLMGAEELGAEARKAALGGFGSKGATKTLAEQVAPDAETVAAAKRLGIEDYLQPDHVTTNQAYRQIAQLVKSQTGSEAAVAQRAGLEKVAERANALIEDIGGTSDISSVSAGVRERMATTQKELLDKADQLYADVRSAIPATSEAPANSVLDFIEQRAKDLGGKENLSPMEKRIMSKLSPKGDQQPTYALLDDVRKDVGAAARAAGPFKDADTGLAKKLYGLLSNDQEAAATALGAGEQYAQARAAVGVRKALEDDMASLFGKQLDRTMTPILSGAVKDLGKGDTSKFVKMIQAVPADMRKDVTASGLSSFFQRTARGGEMDFAGYSKWFDGLERNKQAKAALFSNLPEGAAQQLTDLAKVARGVAMAKGEFIATGKALNPKVLEAADGMMQRIFEEVARRGVTGLAAEAVGSASGAPGLASALISATTKNKPSIMQAADKLIISPEFMAAAKAAGTPAQRQAVSKLSNSQRLVKFLKAAGKPIDRSSREKWVSSAMQAQRTTKNKE